MKLIRVGVDLAKNVFQVHGVDRNEKAVWRRKLMRENWLKALFGAVEPGCEIGMESCGGAHHWARRLQAHGFKVRMIAPQFVKPYVKSNKNDANDAEAICEAMSRPHMRFVAVKTVEQQDIQAVHRIRAELTKQRTAKSNQIRGLVAEYGLVAPKELVQLRRALPCWLEDAENGLSERFRRLLNGLWGDLRSLDERMTELDREIAVIARNDPVAKRLLGISKRGDAYLRVLLIHGARSVIRYSKDKDDRLSQWVTRLAARSHPNVAVVAMANKTTRMAWAMLKNGTDYQPAMVRS